MNLPGGGRAPVMVLNTNTKREHGREAQMNNIVAAKTVADVIRTCLGPRAMLKMVLDAMGTIVLTNDGNAILREIDVGHPAAKSMIELSRAQDENVGDGTTSVIILAGEILHQAVQWLERDVHPHVIIGGNAKALDDALKALDEIAFKVDLGNREQMRQVVRSALGTKLASRWGDLMVDISLDAVMTVLREDDAGRKEVDFKRYAKVEKIPGGEVTDSKVIDGCILNKDVTHSSMRRDIKDPRVILLDCPIEYKKAESQVSIEVEGEGDWTDILKQEEAAVTKMCEDILAFKPDLVITEKGFSDLAQHIFVKAGVTALRRARKSDNNRIARATGAKIVHRTDEITEADVGHAGRYHVEKIGDEYFSYIDGCKDPKACTILLRGATKDFLMEVERNLHDCLNVARNVIMEPALVPGGGAAEMHVANYLTVHAPKIAGVEQWTYKCLANALDVIPRTLSENCGAKTIQIITQLRAKHASDPLGNKNWGIDGIKGELVDMETLGIWEPLAVKQETFKTAVEAANLLLRVDDILSGTKASGHAGGADPGPNPDGSEM